MSDRESKKALKAAKKAAGAAGSVGEKPKKDKKDKKDKKRKAESEAPADPSAASANTSEEEKRAAKKAKKEAKKAMKVPSTSESAGPPAAVKGVPSVADVAQAAGDVKTSRAFLEKNNITVEDSAVEDSKASNAVAFTQFSALDSLIDSRLRDVLAAQKFPSPTPIQAACWPLLLQGKDMVGIAETGSGKTFAFGLPAVQALLRAGKVDAKAGPLVLVVAPTRELAQQTAEQLEKLGRGTSLGVLCLYGGVGKDEQVRALQGRKSPPPAIVVGTPGRLLDLARDGSLSLASVRVVVLDEADRMLDKGFEPDIRAILGMTPSAHRQTAMFSATWPPAVRMLADTFLRDPMRVTVGSAELGANRRITQTVHVLEGGWVKDRKLDETLRQYYAGKGHKKTDRILIFALYKKEAARVEQNLARKGHQVRGIHGDLGQRDRMANLAAFKDGSAPILVATDVAARGLDIPDVELVLNYTFPLTAEDYVHRIGRTGRGGRDGAAITFFTDEDKAHAGELVRILKDANQVVPDDLMKFPTTIKKKTHAAYGDHFKDFVPGKAKKTTFD